VTSQAVQIRITRRDSPGTVDTSDMVILTCGS
jgi:hypothetical protein